MRFPPFIHPSIYEEQIRNDGWRLIESNRSNIASWLAGLAGGGGEDRELNEYVSPSIRSSVRFFFPPIEMRQEKERKEKKRKAQGRADEIE